MLSVCRVYASMSNLFLGPFFDDVSRQLNCFNQKEAYYFRRKMGGGSFQSHPPKNFPVPWDWIISKYGDERLPSVREHKRQMEGIGTLSKMRVGNEGPTFISCMAFN